MGDEGALDIFSNSFGKKCLLCFMGTVGYNICKLSELWCIVLLFTVWRIVEYGTVHSLGGLGSIHACVRDASFVPCLQRGCLPHTKLAGITTGIPAGGPLNHLGGKMCLSPCHFCDNLIKMHKKSEFTHMLKIFCGTHHTSKRPQAN